MSKYLLTLFSFLATFTTSAQRSADIELKINASTNTTIFNEGDMFSIDISLHNNGTDTIIVADSMLVYLYVNNDKFVFFNGTNYDSFLTYHDRLSPGDSLSLLIPRMGTNLTRNLDICYEVELKHTAADTVTDPDITNNKDCFNIYIIPTSVEEVAQESPLQVYPNPAQDIVHWQTPVTGADKTITLYNATGQVVYRHQTTADKGTIALTELPASIYYLKIVAGDAMWHQKVLVE